MDNEVEKRMSEQDEIARKSAEEYALKHREKGEPITRFKERSSLNEFFAEYVVAPLEKAIQKIQGQKEEKLIGGAETEEERHVRGFNKKHVLIIGSLLTILVVIGVSMGTNSAKKKNRKEELDMNRGAVQGQHLSTMPKNYTELASVKKREEQDKARKKEESQQKKDRPVPEKIEMPRHPDIAREIDREQETYRKQHAAAMASPIAFDLRR